MPDDVDAIPPEELGAERDQTREAVVELDAASETVSRLAVTMESVADSHVITTNVQQDMRNYSTELHDLADVLDQQKEMAQSRLHAIEKRIERELDTETEP